MAPAARRPAPVTVPARGVARSSGRKSACAPADQPILWYRPGTPMRKYCRDLYSVLVVQGHCYPKKLNVPADVLWAQEMCHTSACLRMELSDQDARAEAAGVAADRRIRGLMAAVKEEADAARRRAAEEAEARRQAQMEGQRQTMEALLKQVPSQLGHMHAERLLNCMARH